MDVISESAELRSLVKQWQQQEKSISLVPTMGNLHAGHISLVDLAKSKAEKVITTIFVNPLQFNQANDLDNYPRTLTEDKQKLATCGVDLVFAPTAEELYPQGIDHAPRIEIPRLVDEFCGKYRPGHFAGVCTIVAKLFNLCEPEIAIFGEKDYQQLLVIKQLTRDLNFNIEIHSAPTVRETDGLALSSRNNLLDKEQRQIAPMLYKILVDTKNSYATDNIESLEITANNELKTAGFAPEYFNIRDADNLLEITQATENIIILASAWLGNTRLIDNLRFSRP